MPMIIHKMQIFSEKKVLRNTSPVLKLRKLQNLYSTKLNQAAVAVAVVSLQDPKVPNESKWLPVKLSPRNARKLAIKKNKETRIILFGKKVSKIQTFTSNSPLKMVEFLCRHSPHLSFCPWAHPDPSYHSCSRMMWGWSTLKEASLNAWSDWLLIFIDPGVSTWITPRKINVEHNNEGLEDHFPF